MLGEKGIGRLSAMRLGSHLQVITGPLGTTHWEVLEIDWSQLSDLDMDIDQFPVAPVKGSEKGKDDKGTSSVSATSETIGHLPGLLSLRSLSWQSFKTLSTRMRNYLT